MENEFDVMILGAGVVGLSIGKELAEAGLAVGILEKNSKYGLETSSRNSEVIHSGIHYPVGTLKARLCVEGNRLLYHMCRKHNILHRKTGKITVASSGDELPELEKLYRKGVSNGVEEMKMLDVPEVRKEMPYIDCTGALFTGTSGILNVHMLMDFLYQGFKSAGGLTGFSEKVVGVEEKKGGYAVAVEGVSLQEYSAGVLVNCTGLFADRISGLLGIKCSLYWAKGDYFSVEQKFPLEKLVYPLPGKDFLGIHLTPKMGGGLRAGPDMEYVTKQEPPYPDEKKMSPYKVEEAKKKFFCREIRRYLPSLREDFLVPEMYGIRPKLQGPDEDFRDFVIKEEKPGFINLVGIESPGLTGCLAIGKYVKDMVKNMV